MIYPLQPCWRIFLDDLCPPKRATAARFHVPSGTNTKSPAFQKVKRERGSGTPFSTIQTADEEPAVDLEFFLPRWNPDASECSKALPCKLQWECQVRLAFSLDAEDSAGLLEWDKPRELLRLDCAWNLASC